MKNYEKQQALTDDNEAMLDKEPIGVYGMKWMSWMEKNYPELAAEMRACRSYLTTARSVDKRAWEYRELLDSQYEKANPRPESFEEALMWEQTRAFYTDSTVMRERVIFPVTRP